MRYSWRTPKNTAIPTLPSILTFFPAGEDQRSSQPIARESADDRIGEGLEIVPIERSNTSCGKTVSPDTEEKEVLSTELALREDSVKPLPPLPETAWLLLAKAKWYKQPVRRRVLFLLGVQLGILLVIGLSLLSVKAHLMKRDGNEHHTDPVVTTNSKKVTPIPDGSFTLSLGYPRQQSVNCLSKNEESVSWICTSGVALTIKIQSQENTSRQRHFSIQSSRITDQSLYGEQSFSINEASLDPIQEPSPSEHAASHLFRASYDRTILLPESQLSFLGASTPSSSPTPRPNLSPDDRPWLCHFNNTSIEGLIYTSQRATTVTNTTMSAHNNTSKTSSRSFPFVVQITERWQADGTRAYCEQLTSTKGRGRTPGAPEYFLNTTDVLVGSGGSLGGRRKRRDGGAGGACECQWVVQ